MKQRVVDGALILILSLWSPAPPCPAGEAMPARKPNVLFIAVDDLNHWVRHLGRNPQALTPNLDRLAKKGVTFTRAYCAAPVCNPSRAALLSGLRPGSTGVYDNGEDWRTVVPPDLTLVTRFRQHGYWTGGAGKIYHGGFDRDAEWQEYCRGGKPVPAPVKRDNVGIIRWGEVEGGDETGHDRPTADWTIEQLKVERDRPFLLCCGFFKPHMPWEVPKKYFDLYPLDKIELPPFREDDLDDIPPAGLKMAGSGLHDDMVKAGKWKDAVRAYLAAVTYADHEIGRVLDALDASPSRDDTIIVLWGDHGWHLGEKHHWRKFSLWEEATRAPLLWVVPGVTRPGTVCERTVDFMSIYPTLCELAGLPAPPHVEGTSIRKLLADPTTPWERPAITTFHRGNHAVRSERWRYIHYADGGEELYDEAADPYEWTNLAGKPELASVKAELAKWLPGINKPALRQEAGKGKGREKRGEHPPP